MRKLAVALVPLLGLFTLTIPAPAQQVPSLPYKAHTVKSADGVALAVQEWGNPSGPEILFHPRLLPVEPLVEPAGQERLGQGVPHGHVRPAGARQLGQAPGG